MSSGIDSKLSVLLITASSTAGEDTMLTHCAITLKLTLFHIKWDFYNYFNIVLDVLVNVVDMNSCEYNTMSNLYISYETYYPHTWPLSDYLL